MIQCQDHKNSQKSDQSYKTVCITANITVNHEEESYYTTQVKEKSKRLYILHKEHKVHFLRRLNFFFLYGNVNLY